MRIAVLVVIFSMLISILSGCVVGNTPKNGDNTTEEYDTEYRTLPDGYSYDTDGNVVGPTGEIIADPSYLFEKNPGTLVTKGNNWTTLSGDNVQSDSLGIAIYGTIDEVTLEYMPPEGEATRYGYSVYDNDNITMYLNNFVREPGANSGTMILYAEPKDGQGYAFELSNMEINGTDLQMTCTSYTPSEGGYISVPWYLTADKQINLGSVEITTKFTGDDGTEIKIDKLEIISTINNILRLVDPPEYTGEKIDYDAELDKPDGDSTTSDTLDTPDAENGSNSDIENLEDMDVDTPNFIEDTTNDDNKIGD